MNVILAVIIDLCICGIFAIGIQRPDLLKKGILFLYHKSREHLSYYLKTHSS